MADNLELGSATGGGTVATDEVGGLHFQWFKLAYGDDDTATKVTTTDRFPVRTDGTVVVTDLDTLTGGVSGSEYQVDLVDGGTVAAEITAIKTAVEALDNAISGSEMQVDIVSGGEVETSLNAIQTAVETLDDIVSGSEAQVDVVGPLPAGTNAIGKLAANSGVDIGDVDVTSLPDIGGTVVVDTPPRADVANWGGTLYPIALASFAVTGTATEIVAAPGAGSLHVVLGYEAVARGTALDFQLRSATDASLTGTLAFAQNGGMQDTAGNYPVGTCAANEALTGYVSAGTANGRAAYITVPT